MTGAPRAIAVAAIIGAGIWAWIIVGVELVTR